jgi:Zinc-binding dehydrogenase
MSFRGKREFLVQVALRYSSARHAQRSVILDEFVAVTGYERKYAIRLLLGPIRPPQPIRRPRAASYGSDVQQALSVVWSAANGICAKRLVPSYLSSSPLSSVTATWSSPMRSVHSCCSSVQPRSDRTAHRAAGQTVGCRRGIRHRLQRASRVAAARALGADATIDPSLDDPVAAIRRVTGGRGVDVTFEAAGALEAPQQGVDVLRPGGTLVIVGICPDDGIPLTATAPRRKGVTIKLSRRMKHVYPRTIALVEHGLIDLEQIIVTATRWHAPPRPSST